VSYSHLSRLPPGLRGRDVVCLARRVQQRTAIIAKPSLVLADEPTGNLHTDQGREIMELFKRLNREGTTIIQATHNSEWTGYGQRIVKLKDGWMA